MSKVEFKTIEEAVAAYEAIKVENDSLKNEKIIDGEKIAQLQKDLSEAQSIAQDAIEKYNEKPSTGDVIVTVSKKKYKVLFGVDGLTKEELSNDSSKLADLVKLGSLALELIEG